MSAELSKRYRDAGMRAGPRARSPEEIAAYALTRLPATFAAVSTVLAELRLQWQGFAPKSQLDLGAGLGAAAWAAAGLWPSLEDMVAIELEASMLAAGRSLAGAGPQAVARSRWQQGDAAQELPNEMFDLVTISYLLNEIDAAMVAPMIERAWAATRGAIVIVEPGTPDGYLRVIAARAQLLALGGYTVAPCPHDGRARWPAASGAISPFAWRDRRSIGRRREPSLVTRTKSSRMPSLRGSKPAGWPRGSSGTPRCAVGTYDSSCAQRTGCVLLSSRSGKVRRSGMRARLRGVTESSSRTSGRAGGEAPLVCCAGLIPSRRRWRSPGSASR